MRAWELEGVPGVRELAQCRTRDKQGRPISGYLWQLLEGNRPAGDYLHMIESLRTACPGGLLQIGVHPWHLIVSADGQPLPAAAVGRWSEFIARATDLPGVSFVTARDYLDRAEPEG